MKKVVLVALVVVCLAAGVFAGRWWAWRTYSQLDVPKQFEAAQIAAMWAQPLAELRLGETQQAITMLEGFMDDQVSMLADWRDTDPLDAKWNERIDRCLTAVKMYHESYPASGDDASLIKALLATVPGRQSPKGCQNSVCRLDDLRLAKLSAITNTP